MDPALVRYTVTDPLFYEKPGRVRAVHVPCFSVAGADWDGWRRSDEDPWAQWHPAGVRLPEQGWKIHVAATGPSAQETLDLVSGFCRSHALAFKHLAGPAELAASNSKDADRGSAGKFITIYPENDDRLHMALTGLDALVGGRPGPYILSDLRWGDGPLYVRYGAFAQRWTHNERGQRVPGVLDPSGAAVEDRRTAGFTPPSWVPIPGFLHDQLVALGGGEPPADFAYQVTRVLHYSNAGGVYEAVDRDGVTVVLKEGRPNAGLTPDGRDAASRISDEEATLRVLAGPNVVAVRDAFALHGHRFLVLEHVNGRTLSTEVVRRTPAIRADAITADRLAYRQWALGIAGRVEQAVARIHAAGYAHGDLHPGNIVVTPDDDVVLLDFEVASPAKEHASALIGAPGFVVADRRGGLAADRYALACLRIFLFCPLTPLLELDPLKADDILAFIRDTYGLSDDLIDSVRAGLGLPVPPTGPESHLAETVDHAVRMWDMHSQDAVTTLQTMIVRSLGATADYTRDDRIWPGDPRQFSENSYSLAHGAAGVIHALDVVGQEADRRSFDRLNVATGGAIPRAFERVGLFDGLAGVGWLHRRHGHDDLADAVLARIRSTDLNTLGSDLYGGLPGVGLYLLGEAEHHPELVDDARTIASRLCARRVRRTPPDPNDLVPTVRTDHGGLMWGSSGTALFALRLYERTGDPAYLNLAVETVDDDLAHCLVAADGSLQVNEGWRLVPYLATGSVGIGLVLAQLLPHLDNPARYQQALTQITAAVCAPFTIEPGLFYGRAGMIHFLVVLARLGLSTPATEAVLVAHVEGLKLHALRHHGGIGFPGRGLLRMSCDLATGSAGILAALQAYSSLTFDPGRPGWEDTLPHLLTGSTSVPITPEQRPCGKGGDMPWGSSSSSKPLNTMRTQIATLT